MVAPLKLVAEAAKKITNMGEKYYYFILLYKKKKKKSLLLISALMNNRIPFATWTKSFLREIVMQPVSASYICLCVYGFATRERGYMQNFIKNKQEKRGSTASIPPLISRKFQLYSLSSPINLDDQRACALNPLYY